MNEDWLLGFQPLTPRAAAFAAAVARIVVRNAATNVAYTGVVRPPGELLESEVALWGARHGSHNPWSFVVHAARNTGMRSVVRKMPESRISAYSKQPLAAASTYVPGFE